MSDSKLAAEVEKMPSENGYLLGLREIREMWQRILDRNPGSSARRDLSNVEKAIRKAEKAQTVSHASSETQTEGARNDE